jgi:hypothetical protein
MLLGVLMHSSGKVLLIVGGLILLGGIGMMVGGGAMVTDAGDDLGDAPYTYVEESSKSGSLTITDHDGAGEFGFSFWVKGTHVDADNNSMWDDCENVNLTLSNSTADGLFRSDCSYEENYSASENRGDIQKEEQGLIWVGQGCAWNCTNGTYFFDSNTAVWVQYDDEILGDVIGDLGQVLGGGMLWIGSWCFISCGVFLLILGLILGFSIGSGPNVGQVIVQQPGMVMQQPMIMQQPATTQMSQPVFEQPKVYEQPAIETNDPPPGGL